MSRKPRGDEPGVLLHLFGRGVAKRTIFENRTDARYFQSRAAREHRRGRIRVHAYVQMPNHYHILAESPKGEISEGMRVILNEYVRWFNRLRERDGPLFRSRFGSRRIDSESYLWTLIRYIDLHSEGARIVSDAGLYPFGSAYHYLTSQGPKWLSRDLIEKMLTQGLCEYSPELYERMLMRPLSEAEIELVELRMRGEPGLADPLDELLKGGPSAVTEWMLRKAANADGTRPGIAVVSPSHLTGLLEAARFEDPDWSVGRARARRNAWDVMLSGLLRETCRLSHAEVGARLGLSQSCVRGRVEVHRKLLQEVDEYAERASALISEALEVFARPTSMPSVDGGGTGGLAWVPRKTLVLP
ncbi:MAG: transposase [Planctomycetota bacterium]